MSRSLSLAACFLKRWVAAEFLMRQLSIVVGNQHNPEGQEGDADGFSAEVSRESFAKLVRPAMRYFATVDGMAILKRLLILGLAEAGHCATYAGGSGL